MLILVGVTVRVVLDGGLFSKTREATNNTQIEIDRETLISAVLGALNNELKIGTAENLQNNLPEGWNVTGKDGGQYKATSPKGNIFPVDDDGTIHDPLIARNSTELERYIFGEEGYGRNFYDFFDVDSFAFVDNSLDVTFSTYSLIESNDEIKYLYDFYIKYEGKTYKFNANINNNTMTCMTDPTEEIKLVYNPEEGTKVGKYVQYDDEKWIVLYDDSTNGLQMISANILEEDFYLGNRDETIEAAISANKVQDINGDGTISYVEKSIYSYNHAIETLNSKCASLVTPKAGVIKSVRCVGSNPSNPSSENTTPYKSRDLEIWNSLYNGVGYSTDYNFESDFDRMAALGINIATDEEGDGEDYWVASRRVEHYLDSVYFYVRYVDYYGICNYTNSLWDVGQNGYPYGNDICYGLRPVVSLEFGALDNVNGTGTMEDPLILE